MTYLVGKCLLLKHLERKNMTQAELARRIGVPKQQVNKYIKNVQLMSYPIAYNISMVLECDMSDLYDWQRAGK